ncbi:potassium-transporting ATPase subunit KdpC [Granulicella sp. 5B5]|uniref:potassium-transporting ATPase subunit KdpC n=1 Tax=Granulicella sp. 5B5 TaxID=1617967 RepID=UPI0015F4C974|nr:potassium-transporting ATPase subunit KdpC [Granulicella sp. 5B5]QMV20081.1 potassium-transporting ATPase subunit KdpC [Granulicella sp. 5B5]
MKKHIVTAVLYTVVTAVVLGIGYPLAVTGVARLLFPRQANGELIVRDGKLVGSALIGQPFTGPEYFHSRPSAAGTGYDAGASGGSNLAPTSKALIDRTDASVKTEQRNGPVPVDLVTASGSGLDPDITPAAAEYQVTRVAAERKVPMAAVETLVQQHITQRQLGLLGEPRVNVLELNLALDAMTKR